MILIKHIIINRLQASGSRGQGAGGSLIDMIFRQLRQRIGRTQANVLNDSEEEEAARDEEEEDPLRGDDDQGLNDDDDGVDEDNYNQDLARKGSDDDQLDDYEDDSM